MWDSHRGHHARARTCAEHNVPDRHLPRTHAHSHMPHSHSRAPPVEQAVPTTRCATCAATTQTPARRAASCATAPGVRWARGMDWLCYASGDGCVHAHAGLHCMCSSGGNRRSILVRFLAIACSGGRFCIEAPLCLQPLEQLPTLKQATATPATATATRTTPTAATLETGTLSKLWHDMEWRSMLSRPPPSAFHAMAPLDRSMRML